MAINMNGARYKRAGNPPRTYMAFDTHNRQSWAIIRVRRTRGLLGPRSAETFSFINGPSPGGGGAAATRGEAAEQKRACRRRPAESPRRVRNAVAFYICLLILDGQFFPFLRQELNIRDDNSFGRDGNNAEQNERFSTAHGRDGSSLDAYIERLVGSFSK